MMVFTIFIGIFFFLRSGIIYMAIDFEPPEIKKEKVKSESAAPMEMDVSMPKYKLYDNRKIGFGLDFLEWKIISKAKDSG